MFMEEVNNSIGCFIALSFTRSWAFFFLGYFSERQTAREAEHSLPFSNHNLAE